MKIESRSLRNWWVGAVLLWLAFAPLAQAFYNPSAGRWLSRDPVEEKGGKNLYGFVENSPANQTDAKGFVGVWHWKWCISWPSCCCKVRDSDREIYDETRQRFNTLQGGTVVNAIMHCAWMCYVAQRCSRGAANTLGVAHELDHPDNPKKDRDMDFHNNDVGVRIGGTSLQDCFNKCEKAARDGDLYWIEALDPPVPGLPDHVPGPPADDQGTDIHIE